ncbi:uncharacterized protein LOC119188652 [Manduca sexta]|uniref:uncharacterized protein LOC119188652 n=1 Tax=Manduca sexta TaxID=7130 RepID=UPI001890861D|nr:uncharacterized protein LOC119188652 [Manduca sexta]
MFRPVVFAFLLTYTSVLGEKCVGHNFESDFDYLFKSDSYVCVNGEQWQLSNYSSIDIADVPAGSNRFIEPRSIMTCESTTSFQMHEGTLEVNIYMKAKKDEDFLSVFVSELTSNGHSNRGHASFSRRISNYKDGWNTIRIELSSSFIGFISFIGEKSEESIVLIDSFRYFAKDHKDNCILYKDIDNDITIDPDTVESTTESQTWPDPEINTTPEVDMTYSTPEFETTPYPFPEEHISTSAPSGEETTPYPLPEEHISTSAPSEEETTPYPLPEEHTSTSAPSEEEPTPYPLPEEHVSTSAPSEKETTPYPLPEEHISTLPPSELESTPYPSPEEELTTYDPTTDSEPNYQTTNSPIVETEKCVTYNFEKDFDKLFTHNHELCGNFDIWELSNYSSNGIDTINAKGNSYLSPSEDLSCISAFPIRMSPNGLVEVNVYIETASKLDYIIVLVKNVVVGSVDTVAGSIIYEPDVASFVEGWNVLRINVVNLRSFDGYLIFLGAASEGSTVLVDSFRYIPPWANANDPDCQFR